MATGHQGDAALTLQFQEIGKPLGFSSAHQEIFDKQMETSSWLGANRETGVKSLDLFENDPLIAAAKSQSRPEIVVAALPPDGGEMNDWVTPEEDAQTEEEQRPEPRPFEEIQSDAQEIINGFPENATEEERVAAIESFRKLIDEQEENTNIARDEMFNAEDMNFLFDEASADAQKVFAALPEKFQNSDSFRRYIDNLAPLVLSGQSKFAESLVDGISQLVPGAAEALKKHMEFLNKMAIDNADLLIDNELSIFPFIQEFRNENGLNHLFKNTFR